MAESITGSVVGKVKFQIDSQSWKNLEKFQAKMTSVKRQMSSMHKTIKVQAVVKQMTDITKKVTNNSISEKKREMNAHVAEYQKAQARMNRINQRNAGSAGKFDSRSRMYEQIKIQQARHAGVGDADLKKIVGLAGQARANSGGDIAVFRFQLQQLTKDLIKNTREINANRVTLRSLRTDLVQMTAAYTAFSGVVNIAQTGLDMESLRASAKVFAKDEAGIADHMSFISNEADRLGVNLMSATKEFTKFSIATKNTMQKQQQRDLFTGISEYAAVLGASQSDYERAFRAVSQIASKGQLYKEELDLGSLCRNV